MKGKPSGFTLVEVLVSLLIVTIVITISSSLLLNMTTRHQNSSHQMLITEIELFLKIFRNDIADATKSRSGRKQILQSFENGSVVVTFTKPVLTFPDGELDFALITWIFENNSMSRNLNSDENPLILKVEGMTPSIKQIGNSIFYLIITTKSGVYKQILDGR